MDNMANWWIGMSYISLSYFCVPALLMISGALLLSSPKTADAGVFYRKRLLKIIIPLVVWSFIYYVRNHFTMGTTVFVTTFIKRVSTLTLSGHLWFLYMMVGVYLMAPFLRLMLAEKNGRYAAPFVVMCFTVHGLNFLCAYFYHLPLYYHITETVASPYLGYFVLGYLLHHAKPAAGTGRIVAALVFLLAAATTTLGNHVFLSVKTGDEVDLFFQHASPNVVLMSAAAFVFFKSFDYRPLRKRQKALFALSGATYGVYLAHILVLEFLEGRYGDIGLPTTLITQEPLLAVPVLTAAAFLCSLALVLGLKSVPGLRALAP